jgi:hypothetical protein
VVTVLLALLSPPALAKPKFTTFEKVVDGCDVIAMARLSGGQRVDTKAVRVELELTRILKGDVQPGKHVVSFSQYPSIERADSEFVAFLRRGLCWQFVAEPLNPGVSISESLLEVHGFLDDNRYEVGPGVVSLRQIESFIKERSLVYRFQGPLYFPKRGQARWESSNLKMDVVYDAVKRQATVKGLPELKGFPAQPIRVEIGSEFRKASVSVTYADSGVALVFGGDVQELNGKTGVMRTKFYVMRPDLISRQAFVEYVSDPAKGHPYYTVKVACAPFGDPLLPKTLTLTLKKDSGRIGHLDGWSETPLKLTGMGKVTNDTGQTMEVSAELGPDAELMLKLDGGKRPEGEDIFRWSIRQWLLYDLLIADIPGTVVVRRGKTEEKVTTCTLSLGEMRFNKQVPPRTEIDWSEDIEEGRNPGSLPELEQDSDCEQPPEDPLPAQVADSPRNPWALIGIVIALTALLFGGWIGWRALKARRG